MKRDAVELTDKTLDVVMKMAEGNPGAVTVCGKLMAGDPLGFMALLSLDDMDIRGGQIWAAYKDHCGEDIELLRQAIKKRDPSMVATVNRVCPDQKAVTSGASFKR